MNGATVLILLGFCDALCEHLSLVLHLVHLGGNHDGLAVESGAALVLGGSGCLLRAFNRDFGLQWIGVDGMALEVLLVEGPQQFRLACDGLLLSQLEDESFLPGFSPPVRILLQVLIQRELPLAVLRVLLLEINVAILGPLLVPRLSFGLLLDCGLHRLCRLLLRRGTLLGLHKDGPLEHDVLVGELHGPRAEQVSRGLLHRHAVGHQSRAQILLEVVVV